MGAPGHSVAYIVTLVHVKVGVHVSLMRSPDSASHTGPRLLESKDTLDIIAMDFVTRDGVDNGGLNAEEGQRGTTRLGRGDTCQGSDDIGAGLSLPISLCTNVSFES